MSIADRFEYAVVPTAVERALDGGRGVQQQQAAAGEAAVHEIARGLGDRESEGGRAAVAEPFAGRRPGEQRPGAAQVVPAVRQVRERRLRRGGCLQAGARLDGQLGVRLGRPAPGGVVLDDRATVVGVGDAVGVAELLAQPQCRADRAHGLGQQAHHVLLGAQLLEQAGALGAGVGIILAELLERQSEERDGLGVRGRSRRLGRRERRVPQHPRPVDGGDGVVREDRGVARAELLERVQQAAVQQGFDAGLDRLRDREPGELVPESHAAPGAHQQPGRLEAAQRRNVDAERRQQAIVEAVGRDRDELQRVEVVAAERGRAREHCVSHGRGQQLARVPGDLADEEGVPAGDLVHPCRIGAPAE